MILFNLICVHKNTPTENRTQFPALRKLCLTSGRWGHQQVVKELNPPTRIWSPSWSQTTTYQFTNPYLQNEKGREFSSPDPLEVTSGSSSRAGVLSNLRLGGSYYRV